MRCPSCGTENTPDSRFCGGCGAKMATSRVAPTAKLANDAQFPPGPTSGQVTAQQLGYLPTPAPGSMQYAPPAMPPPVAQSLPPPPASAAMSAPSLSMPAVPRRNTTLIAVVVILDLGLAAAGAMLLAKGLAKPAAAPPPAPAPVEAPKPAPPPPPTAAPAPPPPVEAGSAAAPPKQEHKPAKKATTRGAAKTKLDPQDPYADPPRT